MPVFLGGNVFLRGAKPSKHEVDPMVKTEVDPALKLIEKDGAWYLEINFDQSMFDARTRTLVTTELLGKAAIPDLPYEQRDGSPLKLNTDYFGTLRNETNPVPGPIEAQKPGSLSRKVW